MQDNPNLHGGFQLAEEVRQAYKRGQIDYSMEALVRLGIDGIPIGVIKDGDAVIFCCRRGEREVELTEIFTDPDFGHFHRQPLDLIDFTILTLYHEKFKDLSVAFAPTRGSGTLGEMASKAGLKQFRCSESEKFSHVTYFLNGGTNEPYPNEIQKRVPSLKGIPFEQIPELSLLEVTDEIINALQSDLDLVITNFANGDVIGHTSNKEAKVLCAEAIDHNLERVVIEARRRDYITLITADHGNLEVLYTVKGKPHVAHTSNLVPLIIIDPLQQESMKPEPGKLADLAPTILAMLNVPVSKEMNGNNLLPDITWHQGRKILLIILDGWGEGPQDETNPIFLGQTPFWDEISSRYPHTSLAASGEAVGLQTGKP
ncbi:MAG: hypothetical protein MUO40_04085, partial [Anaerolineaceae bacterium]|nr:hypothetical protein [Anaerolineaceae bacterium]